jgi:hypothetical protein
MHYLSSVYWVTIPLHVSRLLVAHHQEVTMYICNNWYVLHVLIECRLKRTTRTNSHIHTVSSESRCALMLRYVDLVQACIDPLGHHFQHLLQVHSDFPNADLEKGFANKIKPVQACVVDITSITFYKCTTTFRTYCTLLPPDDRLLASLKHVEV